MRTTFPSSKELQDATLEALKRLGGQGTPTKIKEQVVDILSLSDEVVNLEDESGIGTKLDYQLRWSRTKLKGQIENVQRGVWRIVE